MKVLVVQNKVHEKIEETLNEIKGYLNEVKEKLDFIILPEMFMMPYELKYMEKYKQSNDSEVLNFLSGLAKDNNAYLIGGSIPYTADSKIFNRSYIFDRNGKVITQYDKIHLFEVTYPNGLHFSEAKVLTRGTKPTTFDTEFGKMGVMICFDIRFPLLANKLMNDGCKCIFVPAAFNTYTGPMHWHTTFKSRAIDNQLFIVASSPARNSFGKYEPFGHSLVCNPLGRIINELDEKPGYFITDIDIESIERTRAILPIVKNSVDFD